METFQTNENRNEEKQKAIEKINSFDLKKCLNDDAQARLLRNAVADYYVVLEKHKYINFGLEIFESTISAMKSYNEEKGEFFRYLHTIVKKRIKRAIRYEKMQNATGGMHIPRETQRKQRALLQCMGKYRMDPNELTEDDINLLALEMQIEPHEVRELVSLNYYSKLVDNIQITQEGDESSVIDSVPDNNSNIFDKFEEKEIIEERLQRLDRVYKNLQDREKLKQAISMKLTIIEYVNLLNSNNLNNYSFVDKALLEELKTTNVQLKDKDIAERLALAPSDVSRKWTNFQGKLKEARKN